MSISQSDVDRLRRAVLASLHEHWRLLSDRGDYPHSPGSGGYHHAAHRYDRGHHLFRVVVAPQRNSRPVHDLLDARGPGFWWSLISAILAIVVGVMLIGWPVRGAFSLTFLLIAFFIIEGVLSVMFALDHRKELPGAWGWMLASGIVDLALATIIIAGLPGTAAWAIGLLVGINLTFGGVALVAMALQARRIDPTISTAG